VLAYRPAAIDINEPTEIAELGEVLFVRGQEALDREWRAKPRPIELGDEHAELQILDRDDFSHDGRRLPLNPHYRQVGADYRDSRASSRAIVRSSERSQSVRSG